MLKNKRGLMVLSLILAVCLWGFVMGEVNPTVTKVVRDIPVEFTNVESLEDRDLAMKTSEGYTVDLAVEGKRADLNYIDEDDIQVTADMFGYEEGENHVAVDVVLPDGVDLKEARPAEITVDLEELVSKKVSVEVTFTGNHNNKMEPGDVEVVPAEVEVKGAESVVADVKAVRVQIESADLSQELETFNEVPAAVDKKGKVIKNVSISATSVEVRARLYDVKTVPLEIKVTGNVDEEYGTAEVTIPEEITIRGSKEDLEKIDRVIAESIDISEVTEDVDILITPYLLENVELANSSKDISIKIEFK